MSIVVCQEKNTYLHYFIFPLNFPGLLKSEGGQGRVDLAIQGIKCYKNNASAQSFWKFGSLRREAIFPLGSGP